MTGTGDAPAAVEATGLAKWYGAATALDGVDLRVERGSIHALLGPNGAGKTTLLAMIFGLTLPDEGTLRLFGRSRSEAGAAWLEGVGGFIEIPRFYPYLTGRANLCVLARLDGGDALGLVDDALEAAGLAAAADRKVRGYSLGMRQRLGVAAAMLRRPRLLVLDEPTNGMDPAGIRDLRHALRQLASGGVAVVLASHDVGHVAELCDTITMLDRGRVAWSGPIDAIPTGVAAWTLETSDNARAAALAEAAAGIDLRPAAAPPGATEPGLALRAAQSDMDGLVLGLAAQGVAVRGLAMARSPLEELYFRLTAPTGTGS